MISKIDLHLHSTASDGQYTPAELVRMALERGLVVISITDHESTEGLEPALKTAKGTSLEIIPGVEISTDLPKREAHLLGYYIDYHHPHLQQELRLLRRSRRERAKGMIAKLAGLGMPLEWEEIIRLAGNGSIGRPHIAQAMVKRGYVASTDEAFVNYIGRNGPAYVERYRLTPEEATHLIKEAGGLPVLAHPANVLDLLPRLVKEGLVGLECYYTGYSAEQMQDLAALAQKYGLIPTGGSDFHGQSVFPAAELGGVWVPLESVERLRELAGTSTVTSLSNSTLTVSLRALMPMTRPGP